MRRTTLTALLALLPIATLTAQQRTVNVGNAVINYDISGKGKTVVFIHGWAHNLSVWDDQVPALKSRYRVLRYDSPGFGRSTGVSDESAEPRDLLVLMEALHIDHAYIVGHSRGGGVALRFAVRYPKKVDGLVLYGATSPGIAPVPDETMAMFGSLPAIAKNYGLDSVGKLIFTTPLAWVPAGRNDVTARYHRLWASYSGKDLLNPRPESGAVPAPQLAQLNALKIPTLVIIGDHEVPFIAAEADTFAHRIPNAKKVVIPNAGHGAHFAQPASFNSALLDFFYDVERNKKK
ncbi:MAG: alpha/beta fold hydrolase [Gemmatimonadaceae bacterium]